MIRRKLKPREYAAQLVSGEIKLDDVPEERRNWCVWHISAVSKQLKRKHDSREVRR